MRSRTGVEFNDVSGGGWFFLMACEMFVLGKARLSFARSGFLSPDRGQCG